MSNADKIKKRYDAAHDAIHETLIDADDNGWISRGEVKSALRTMDEDSPRQSNTEQLMEGYAKQHDDAFYHPDRKELIRADHIFTTETLYHWSLTFYYSSETDFGMRYLETLDERTAEFGLKGEWIDVEKNKEVSAIPAYRLRDDREDGEQLTEVGDRYSAMSGVQLEYERIRTAIAHAWFDFMVDESPGADHEYMRDRIG